MERSISIGTASRSGGERGFTLVATALCMMALVGMLGLAVDLGRLYITKNEAQAFADAAALAAAKQLNGKSTGITAAKTAVLNTYAVNKWQMGSANFSGTNTTVEFSTSKTGPWSTNPAPANVAFARVTATPSLNMTFIRAVGAAAARSVQARSVGGLVQATFPKGGYLPYRVIAHTLTGDPNFGLSPGQEYTIRWPSNARTGNNTCKGDNAQVWIDNAGAGSSSERGYFELQSAAAIRAAILGQRQLIPLAVGDIVNLTNGNKQTERDALITLALRDSDQTTYSPNANGTLPAYSGNGSRLVILPITSWSAGLPVTTPVIQPDQVLVFGTFLIPMSHDQGGNKSWCAIYMGAKATGSEGLAPYSVAGAFSVKLVQ